jgi:hypothetical protein
MILVALTSGMGFWFLERGRPAAAALLFGIAVVRATLVFRFFLRAADPPSITRVPRRLPPPIDDDPTPPPPVE